MAVKKTKYYREFVGTDPEPLDPYSSNEINEKDKKIRKDIINKFSGESFYKLSRKEIHQGFDGSQQYSFTFYEENWEKNKKHPKYNLVVEISKTGNEEMIKQFPCDLENFLTDKDGPKFKKIRKE